MTQDTLRRRRRNDLQREIRDAALDLFDERGFESTTMDDIARAVGVSRRTVFRHAETKERAALLPDAALYQLLDDQFRGLVADRPLVPQFEEAWGVALKSFDEGRSESGRLALRLWRLVPREPRLLLAGLAVEHEQRIRVQRLLAEWHGIDPLTTCLIVERVGIVVRTTLDQWASGKSEVGLMETYAGTRALLQEHNG